MEIRREPGWNRLFNLSKFAGFRPCRRGTFAETKVTRRAGATPRIIIPNTNDNPQHPTLTKMIPSHRKPGSPMKDVGDDKCGGPLWGLRFRAIGFGTGNGGIGAEVLIGLNDAA